MMATPPAEFAVFDAQLAQQTHAALASPSLADKEAVLALLPDNFEHTTTTGRCPSHQTEDRARWTKYDLSRDLEAERNVLRNQPSVKSADFTIRSDMKDSPFAFGALSVLTVGTFSAVHAVSTWRYGYVTSTHHDWATDCRHITHTKKKLSLAQVKARLRAQIQQIKDEQVPVLMKEAFANNFADQLALKLHGDTVHVCLLGLAGVGKSTIFNFMTYALRGARFASGRQTVQSIFADGQCSTQCFREPASVHLGWDVKQKGDLVITDTVGFKGDEGELFAIGNGKLKEVEAWPRGNAPDDIHKRAEILSRATQTARPTCLVLFISVQQFFNVAVAENDRIVRSVIETAKNKFTAGEFQVEIPLMIVVTKVDSYDDDVKKEDLLLQRKSPKLGRVVAECSARFGVSKDDVFALGFLNEADVIDFSPESKDPRVVAVRHLVLRMTESAEIARKRISRLTQ